jgi:hypothetical protein
MKKVLFIILGLISVVYSSATDKIDVEITMAKNAEITQNSVGLLEISLDIKNLNPKTIKYMWVEIDAYNTVGDVLSPYPGTNKCKGTGPIVYNQIHSSGGCGSYYESFVSEIKVRIAKVEYLDGSINENPTDYYIFDRSIQNKNALDSMKRVYWAIMIGMSIFTFLIS